MKASHLSIAMAIAAALCPPAMAQHGSAGPQPHVVQLDKDARESADVFNGPPETVSVLSGYMVLAPGDSVAKHSTGTYEEVVIVLSGSGEMRVTGGGTFGLKPCAVAYCPPLTEHAVVNTGPDTLRYIWVAAKK